MVRNRAEVQNKQETEEKIKPQQCSGIMCPNCTGSTRVRNGRPLHGVHGRYRKCDECGTTFYTEESVMRIINIPKKE